GARRPPPPPLPPRRPPPPRSRAGRPPSRHPPPPPPPPQPPRHLRFSQAHRRQQNDQPRELVPDLVARPLEHRVRRLSEQQCPDPRATFPLRQHALDLRLLEERAPSIRECSIGRKRVEANSNHVTRPPEATARS